MSASAAARRPISLEKQALYGAYANGKISLDDLGKAVGDMAPQSRASKLRKVATFFVWIFGALVLPHWGARKD